MREQPRSGNAAPAAAVTPPNGITWRSYYYAGSTRVAVRTQTPTANVVYPGLRWAQPRAGFLLGDHLGSTSVAATSSGVEHSRQLYTPWGESRWASGSLPTDLRYTGQRSEAGLGSLYDYGARMYSPRVGRFLSADTIVPSPGNPQSLNRYAYALNNPVKYVDPTGHASECGETAGGSCGIEGHVDWGDKSTDESWADYFARKGMNGGKVDIQQEIDTVPMVTVYKRQLSPQDAQRLIGSLDQTSKGGLVMAILTTVFGKSAITVLQALGLTLPAAAGPAGIAFGVDVAATSYDQSNLRNALADLHANDPMGNGGSVTWETNILMDRLTVETSEGTTTRTQVRVGPVGSLAAEAFWTWSELDGLIHRDTTGSHNVFMPLISR